MSDAQRRLSAALAGRYEIEGSVGEGGMATVHVAMDLKHHRKVAIKVLRPELAASLGPDRFLREIAVAANLHHPHILPLYDSGQAAGILYYVMPLVEGETLRERIARERQLPVEDALRIASEVADALTYAHSHGVVHRDIKPENILLESGHALLSDFGIAHAVSAADADRLTQTGLAIGTPIYMSPEQAAGEREPDGRSDLYSLACVLYEMLAGQPPFTGATTQSLLHQHAVTPPPPISRFRAEVPLGVAGALAHALAKAPADRFASVGQFASVLAGDGRARAAGRWSPRARRIVLGAVLVLVPLAAVLAVARHRSSRAERPATRSIAVLPFQNIGADRGDQYFSEGMSEELIIALSRVEGLHVAARTSAFSFQGRAVSARVIGRELGVATLLEGTVRRGGDRLRISARLINTASGFELWSEEYERDAKDVFSVQDEIARAIVGALRIRLVSPGALARRGTVIPEAHDLYLQGRFFYEKRNGAGLRRALDFFQRAIARDSGYAEAWAGLADTYAFMSGFGYEPPHVMFSLAREAAARALRLDSTLVEAHTSLAYIKLFYDWDWAGAGREFDRALAIDSTFPRALLFHAWYYVALGRLDDAHREVMRALAADPLSPIINLRVATMLHWQGRYAEAIPHLRRVLEMDSTYSLARAQLIQEMAQLRQCDAIRQELATHAWVDQARNYNGAAAGYALAVCGDRAAARKQADSLTVRARQTYVSPEVVALIHAGLGNNDSAFAWLDRAVADRTWSLFLLKVEPMLNSLHGDPRFDRLVRAVGLP